MVFQKKIVCCSAKKDRKLACFLFGISISGKLVIIHFVFQEKAVHSSWEKDQKASCFLTEISIKGITMGRILAVDYGNSRTGIALSDLTKFIAYPYTVINQKDKKKLADEILNIAESQGVSIIIIGNPKNMDGSLGFQAKTIQDFEYLLNRKIYFHKLKIEIIKIDERLSSVAADKLLISTNPKKQKRQAKRKKMLDSISATIVLQGYLDSIHSK